MRHFRCVNRQATLNKTSIFSQQGKLSCRRTNKLSHNDGGAIRDHGGIEGYHTQRLFVEVLDNGSSPFVFRDLINIKHPRAFRLNPFEGHERKTEHFLFLQVKLCLHTSRKQIRVSNFALCSIYLKKSFWNTVFKKANNYGVQTSIVALILV